ncbi:MAG: NrsF family protein [Candidatus Binatales bacterium]
MSETAQARGPASYEALHRAVVERIVAELRPVRRTWPVSVRWALWLSLEAGVLLFLIYHGHRPDLGAQLRNPSYLLGVASFAAAGLLAAAFTLRAAIPGREPRTSEIGFLVLLAGASAMLLFRQPIDGNVPMAQFISTGVPCAIGVATFATVPWLAILWATRRAAPLSGAKAGTLAGAAAFLFTFALMRVACPIDERMHLMVWHLMPALIGTALSACVGAAILRRRR